jgi:hypothetical protein
MWRRALLLPALLVGACAIGREGAPPTGGRLLATVVRLVSDTLRDTVRFEGAVETALCDSARGVLLDGVTGGNGVLLWVRPGDSTLAGEYDYAARGAPASQRGVVAAVRFVASDIARGVTLDSGRVRVTEREGFLSAAGQGAGPAFPGASRVFVRFGFEAVPVPRDTVSCAPLD